MDKRNNLHSVLTTFNIDIIRIFVSDTELVEVPFGDAVLTFAGFLAYLEQELKFKLLQDFRVVYFDEDDELVAVSNELEWETMLAEHVGAVCDVFLKPLLPKSGRTSGLVLDQDCTSFTFRESLVESIRDHACLLVQGDSNCGLRLQMPLYLMDNPISGYNRIFCAFARDYQMKATAIDIAETLGVDIENFGLFVKVVFEDFELIFGEHCTFLKEMPKLDLEHSIFILYEIEMREIYGDILLGYLKLMINRTDNFKLVSFSTVIADDISDFLDSCPIFQIPGKFYPIEIFYTSVHEKEYINTAAITVIQLHLTQKPGNIAVYLPSELEYEEFCSLVSTKISSMGDVPTLSLCCLYNGFNTIKSLQSQTDRILYILSDEISIPTPLHNITCVIDTGFTVVRSYNADMNVIIANTTRISKNQARRRAAIGGISSNGQCFRLYTQTEFDNFSETLPVEILRENITDAILLLKALGISEIHRFPLIDRPPLEVLTRELDSLQEIGALDEFGYITQKGRDILDLPLSQLFEIEYTHS